MVLKKPDELREIVVRIFMACRVPADSAEIVADHLVRTEMMGFGSHGIQRVAQYVNDLRNGQIVPDAQLSVTKETATTAVLDAQWQFGLVAGVKGTELAVSKAFNHGTGSALIRHCRHFGRLGTYTEMMASRNCIGLAACNAGREGHWVAPFGGREGRLGTNPISFAAPTDSDPILMDFSTSIAPEGKVRLYRDTGRTLPEPWLVNSDGQPSTDPKDLYDEKDFPAGAILPFGGTQGYKGYGLSLMVQTICGVLGGPAWRLDGVESYSSSMWVLAMHLGAFTDPDSFHSELQGMTDYIRSSAAAAGADKVLLPGQREFELMKKRKRDGIPIDDAIWKRFVEVAEEAGVQVQ